MSFSWWCKDKDGNDLFAEFKINGQALGLAQEGQGLLEATPFSILAIRNDWLSYPYANRLEEAAKDAVGHVQVMVKANLKFFIGPEHQQCPCCTCQRKPWKYFGFDIEQAKRFLEIPLERIWRAGGGRRVLMNSIIIEFDHARYLVEYLGAIDIQCMGETLMLAAGDRNFELQSFTEISMRAQRFAVEASKRRWCRDVNEVFGIVSELFEEEVPDVEYTSKHMWEHYFERSMLEDLRSRRPVGGSSRENACRWTTGHDGYPDCQHEWKWETKIILTSPARRHRECSVCGRRECVQIEDGLPGTIEFGSNVMVPNPRTGFKLKLPEQEKF